MENCNTTSLPILSGTCSSVIKLEFGKGNVTDEPYCEIIGLLIYALLGTRPDLVVAVSYHSRFQDSATQREWTGSK